jgi:RNA polymerase sigma-70 factor (ECF subfamily)
LNSSKDFCVSAQSEIGEIHFTLSVAGLMTSDVNSAIAQRLKDRDKSAWNEVSSEHTRDLFGFIVRLVGFDRSAADDVVQEVWLECLNRIQHFDPTRCEFRGWLFEIARRRVAAFWRKRASVPCCEDLNDGLAMESQLLPTEILDRLDCSAIVRAALLAMAPERSRVLTAKYLDDQSVAQIAASEGKSMKAIESLLTRARDDLRVLLGPHFDSINSNGGALRRPCSIHSPETEAHL